MQWEQRVLLKEDAEGVAMNYVWFSTGHKVA